MIYFAVKLPILEFHKLHTITGRTFFQAPYAEHQWQPYFTMARQYKKVEILGLPMFDPAPEALRLNCIPSTHKASDMVISLLQIAHKAKIVPCSTLMDLHYCFMSNL